VTEPPAYRGHLRAVGPAARPAWRAPC
jgi:hypothetical protein